MPKFMTVAELAAKLRISRWTIYAAINDGLLKGYRLRERGRFLFDEAEAMQSLGKCQPEAAIMTEHASKAPTIHVRDMSPQDQLATIQAAEREALSKAPARIRGTIQPAA